MGLMKEASIHFHERSVSILLQGQYRSISTGKSEGAGFVLFISWRNFHTTSATLLDKPNQIPLYNTILVDHSHQHNGAESICHLLSGVLKTMAQED